MEASWCPRSPGDPEGTRRAPAYSPGEDAGEEDALSHKRLSAQSGQPGRRVVKTTPKPPHPGLRAPPPPVFPRNRSPLRKWEGEDLPVL